MSLTDAIAILAIIVTVLLALVSCTWYLSGRIEKIKVIAEFTAAIVEKHTAQDDRRFDEVFGQQRELAKQNFWMLANVQRPQSRKGKANLQDAETFAETNG